MSFLRAEFTKIAADSVGVEISPEVAKCITLEVESRLSAIIKDAVMLMNQSCSDVQSCEDISDVLGQHGQEQVFGYPRPNIGGISYTKNVDGHDYFFAEDGLVKQSTVTQAGVSVAPEPTLSLHWLAVNGEQPLSATNPDLRDVSVAKTLPSVSYTLATAPSRDPKVLSTTSSQLKWLYGTGALVQTDAVHALTVEQMRCLEMILRSVRMCNTQDLTLVSEVLCKQVGFDALVPFLSNFIITNVRSNTRNIAFLQSLIILVQAMTKSPYLNLSSHLHQLLPALLTCVQSARVGYTPSDPHHSVRVLAGRALVQLCRRHHVALPSITSRVMKTLAKAVQSCTKPYPTVYGALHTLRLFGSHSVYSVVLPFFQQLYSYIYDGIMYPGHWTRTGTSLIARDVHELDENMQQTPVFSLANAVSWQFHTNWKCFATEQTRQNALLAAKALLSCIVVFVQAQNETSVSYFAQNNSPRGTDIQQITLNLQKQMSKTLLPKKETVNQQYPFTQRHSCTALPSQDSVPLPLATSVQTISHRNYASLDELVVSDRLLQIYGEPLRAAVNAHLDPLSLLIL